MKKLSILLFSILITLSLSSCDLFENKGDINDYVGTYKLESAHETVKHVYWGSEKEISSRNIMETGAIIVIKDDKTVIYTESDGTEHKGRIKCLENYCRFFGTPLDSSYKFYMKYDGSLYYSYESLHMSVEYDVTYRSIILTKQS